MKLRLTNSIALRTEIGLDFGINGNDNTTTTALIPSVRVEPRWCYNLEKEFQKIEKSPIIAATSWLWHLYNPDWFYISNKENINVISTVAFIPKWGIKRTVGNHFTYEARLVLVDLLCWKDYETDTDVALDLHLRIGYTF